MHHVKANGAAIPALGLGTFTLKDATCRDMVARALDTGYRHVDTAAMYGNEEAVGEGLRQARTPRDDVFVTTKVWFTDIAPGDLEASAEASLRRLGLDHVDLLLIHWPNPAIPLAESIGALNRAQARGLARHIGVSNFNRSMLAEAVALSDAPLVCNQVEYHPQLNQTSMLAELRRREMALVAYCPLGRGETLSDPAVVAAARAHGKTAGQVILRWQVQQPGVVAIPRTSNPDRLAENLDIFDFELSASEMEAISALRVAGRRICDYPFDLSWEGD
ncbi:aldo/keto reductase [Hoeflea olei]|uniref:2,5-didehydrogluconate reductase n=1 Tax=Hoeflea olei TaxID=1480615 RepID=A0A1C1YSV3_9HYPH|nr:aldo/keto reductase [Hoeflea olei]OCW56608.1 2,5-didehydrogluconate reductase [Hoeflea olei]